MSLRWADVEQARDVVDAHDHPLQSHIVEVDSELTLFVSLRKHNHVALLPVTHKLMLQAVSFFHDRIVQVALSGNRSRYHFGLALWDDVQVKPLAPHVGGQESNIIATGSNRAEALHDAASELEVRGGLKLPSLAII